MSGFVSGERSETLLGRFVRLVSFALITSLMQITLSPTAIAAPAGPSLSIPATFNATTGFSNVGASQSLSVSGYQAGDQVQVNVSVDSGNVKLGTTTGLSVPTGYTTAQWTANDSTAISFLGAQSDVSTALNSLQYKAATLGTTPTITITTSVAGSAYNPDNGHFYEVINNGSSISWELARCKAKYSNSDVSVGAGTSTKANDRCQSATALERRTKAGLKGYLANITSLDEHKFLKSKLADVGWIGGADTEVEGTWVWVDGPESGEVFWVVGQSATRRGLNNVTGAVAGFSYGNNRFNYWSNGEPNNASAVEHYAEFGFGTDGTEGSSWNDCQLGCNRTRYVIEYGGEAGDVLSGANGTIAVRTAPGAPTGISPTAGTLSADLTWSASASGGDAISGYKVEYKASGGSWQVATENTGSSSTSYTVTGLTGGTIYTFRITARNSLGLGTTSSESSSITAGKIALTVTAGSRSAAYTASPPYSIT